MGVLVVLVSRYFYTDLVCALETQCLLLGPLPQPDCPLTHVSSTLSLTALSCPDL